jgi:hypothetical protein
MTAWLDREVAGGGDAPRTHALVIGVSHYQFLPQQDSDPAPAGRQTFGLREAKTPATSAWNFARWLTESYSNPSSPLASVRLLLSPSQWERENIPELANLPDTVLPATRDNVADALDEWHDLAATSPDNVAILYAAGHGIQLSKDDGGIVLLEDFARRGNSPLDHSLDVPGVRKGMAGPTMAQQQFYFIDACRVRPPEAVDFQTLGAGVTLKNPFEGAPLCSAVYFSASPSTEALGETGKGTLFLQALLDCLELAAVDDHVHENGWWVVTTGTLMRALPRRVAELARSFQREQMATVGGQLADVVLHVLPAAPEVTLTLELDPAEAAGCAVARLWDGRGTASVFDNEQFTPTLTRPVPAGWYVLTVRIQPPTPPYKEVPAQPIPALPPGLTTKVLVHEPV